MPVENSKLNTALIAAITPEFLNRGVLWFKENEAHLKKEARLNSYLGRHLLTLETDQEVKLLEILKDLTDFGYERVQTIGNRGEFSQQGGVLRIFLINREAPLEIEFAGNRVETLKEIKSPPLQKTRLSKKTKADPAAILKEGDFVVHLDHGIGFYRGLVERDGQKFFLIEYAKKDRLFVPLTVSEKISPYVGFQTPTVHRLGGSLWLKTRKKATEDIMKFARELVEVYAQREQKEGFRFSKDTWLDRELAGDFPFKETPDQHQAIRRVFADMESKKIMDHLVCGDVGFGKTEVALRAAFKAVNSGKQAALLAPTTILAGQHFETFKKRLDKFAVKLALMSRLSDKKEQGKNIQAIKDGQIDIIIGTHRLLQKDVQFKNLGLLIIDEEQRFGVRQKEQMKKFKAEIDVLSLSATPIPRTLHLSLSGLRDVSQIKTAPPGRRAIKTFVLPFNEKTLKRAVDFELKRRGQVYFLHNRVATMDLVVKKLQKQFPKKRIARIHGRLPEQEMARVIEEFKNGRIDILAATTIIENGLDFPDVNTLIVSDSSRLGLAQAYQLRGRIGRGDRQAFAYFFYPTKHLTEKAADRLEALQKAQSLGSGYELVLKDLEIRGAGNILGPEQSGAVNKIGLNLYYQLLNEAVEEMKK